MFRLVLSAALLGWACLSAMAQEAAPTPKAPAVQPPAKPVTTRSPYRKLAPGVMQTIDPMRAMEESVERHDVVELLSADPKLDFAKDVPFRRDIWALEFRFKPMRMIWVDIPQPSGKMQRKLIWYMVYSVTNTGKVMHPVEDVELPYETFAKKQLFQVKMEDRPVQFTPEFLLEGHQHMKEQAGFTKVYADRVIPLAMLAIQQREDPRRRFLNTVDMCRSIAVNETLWGIATWEDIDPRIVRFSTYVSGLTNAYRWKDLPGEQKKGEVASGRRLYRKTLKLNFWRPGDSFNEHEEEIRYGVPGGVDYQWVYR
ncbi:MAG: hypothetical protein ABFC96_14660 [Thermoguttaceae bacterium]